MGKIIILISLVIISCNTKIEPVPHEEPIVLDSIFKETKVGQKKDEKKAKELAQFFRVKKDEFENIEWITPKSAPIYTNYDSFYCYFAIKEGYATNLRLVLQYVSDDWLFIKSAKFLVDGKVYEFYPKDVKRDNDSGEIWEWWDERATDSDIEMLRKISDSKEAKIKLNGTQYFDVVKITAKQKLNIKRCLDYYESLGGN